MQCYSLSHHLSISSVKKKKQLRIFAIIEQSWYYYFCSQLTADVSLMKKLILSPNQCGMHSFKLPGGSGFRIFWPYLWFQEVISLRAGSCNGQDMVLSPALLNPPSYPSPSTATLAPSFCR